MPRETHPSKFPSSAGKTRRHATLQAGAARGAPDTVPPAPPPSAADGRAILLLAPQPFYEDRGTPIAVRQVLEALSELGYLTDVVTYPVGRSLEIQGVSYFRAANPFRIRHVPIGFSARKLLLDAFLVPAAWKRLRARGYRAIHAVEEAAFPAIGLGRRFGVPVVYDMQSSLPEQLRGHRVLGRRPAHDLVRAGERWLLRRVDFVATSAGLAPRVKRIAPDARVREWRFAGTAPTIRPDQVANLRRSLAIPQGAPVVVYSGTFATYQGLPNLMGAIPAVLREVPETVFVLVGAVGSEGRRVAKLSDGPVPDGSVRLVERQPRERVPDYLAMADVLVSSRVYGANLPLKIFDYLAAGKPIVATDVPAHRAVLDSARAELVEPGPGPLARAILGLLRDPARAAALAARAQEYAERNLGRIAFDRSVAEIYEEVGASSAPAPGSAKTPLAAPLGGQAAAPVLCVDLDGTLLATDLLWLSTRRLLRLNPAALFRLPVWLVRGKAHLKRQIARRVTLDPVALPYRPEVLAFLRAERAQGRRLVLATASDAEAVAGIALHLGLFSDVLASDGRLNLSGSRKLEAMERRFGARGFDYAGNAAVDLHIWRHANAAIVVTSSPRFLARVERIARVRRVFPA